MEIEIKPIDNGYIVIWEFGLITRGERFYKTLPKAIRYAKNKLDQYKDYWK